MVCGFTTKLLCIVWVGYDDYRDLKIEGAHSRLPIWTDFMKRAHTHRAYRTANDFDVPDGVVGVQMDPQTGELATSACPDIRTDILSGRHQPTQFCHLHGGGRRKLQVGILPRHPNLAPPPNQMASRRHLSRASNCHRLLNLRQKIRRAFSTS